MGLPLTGARRRIAVRRSGIHGRGVFALVDIPAGERLIEYLGDVITWDVAQERWEASAHSETGTTYFFDRGDGTVIDGAHNGNSARFLNHACAPNCEAIDHDGRIVIHTVTDIRAGDELSLDYALQLDDAEDEESRRLYDCRCGGPTCRRTMLEV
jgi:SET domain-containing protein